MPNPVHIYTFFIQVGWLFGFYGISTTMGYLMPNPVHIYTFLLRLVGCLGSMAYQTLRVI